MGRLEILRPAVGLSEKSQKILCTVSDGPKNMLKLMVKFVS